MRYANIKKNDVVNGEGVNVSLFVQGCPHHCKGCFNTETFSFDGGKEFTEDTYIEILNAINKNGVKRDFSVLGGEPLAKENFDDVIKLIKRIKADVPRLKVYVWSGYTIEELALMYNVNDLCIIDILIDGRFVEELKDYSLKLRGSSNQRIINIKEYLRKE